MSDGRLSLNSAPIEQGFAPDELCPDEEECGDKVCDCGHCEHYHFGGSMWGHDRCVVRGCVCEAFVEYEQ